MNDQRSVAVVTGGTRGIGLEITRALINEGYKVAAVFQNNEEAARACEDETGAKAFKANVSNFSECEALALNIENELGPVSVLVNNAGITRDGVLHKMTPDAWHTVLETNLTSCFNMCRAFINGLRERGYGRIINISSINGQKGQFGQANYAAAKAGMIGFSKSLALESATKGITVNTVCPGYIKTDMTSSISPEVLDKIVKAIPVGRMGEAEEVAALVSFLASEKAAYITGATIAANGGQYMSG